MGMGLVSQTGCGTPESIGKPTKVLLAFVFFMEFGDNYKNIGYCQPHPLKP